MVPENKILLGRTVLALPKVFIQDGEFNMLNF